ncbi:MAG: hypothetical protein JXA23_02255 [Bacteroidales bacterium]|nr:hypothetical protein [Bacteroidales bacterium]
MRTLVVYYSRKGSNRFLAHKVAGGLSADIERIRPWINVFLLFLLKIHLGIRPIRHKAESYDKVILVGPIWMGRLIPPLRSFLNKYKERIRELVFVTCCGSTDARKDEKFGHGFVFREVEHIMGDKCTHCRAFPIDLVLPEEKKGDDQAFMQTHLMDENFRGEIQDRLEDLIDKIRTQKPGRYQVLNDKSGV